MCTEQLYPITHPIIFKTTNSNTRNPRIAEFLKAYKLVKEYGEEVDRIYNELESAGLHEPEYFCNAFVLQTVIDNKNYNYSDRY